jgi:hypothetical protein
MPPSEADEMNTGGRMIDDMKSLVRLFSPRCADPQTMDDLEWMLGDEERWITAHDLSGRIRTKSHVAVQDGNRALAAQYYFGEICARTLFNLTDTDAPFDEDTPYWIIPSALRLARALEIDDSQVLDIVAA